MGTEVATKFERHSGQAGDS